MDDYFTLLNIDESFDLDEAQLEKNYFQLQNKYHPDRFVNKSADERLGNLKKSMVINEAYQVLKKPLKRAEYILKQHGVGELKACSSLLMEVMEQREALAEELSVQGLEKQENIAAERVKNCINELQNAFAKGDYDEAGQCAVKLKYLEKLSEEIRRKKLGMM